MEKVLDDLVALNDDSVNPLGVYNIIRESCTTAATAIAKAALPRITEEDATKEIDKVHQHFHKARRALGDITSANRKVVICAIAVDAVKRAAQQAASNNKGYRVNAWVFAISAMANGAACNIIMETHYSV